jgi:hypothetical protein
MKLNYTSLQHAVVPVENNAQQNQKKLTAPVAICLLHGQLAPVAWAFAQQAPNLRLGYVQTGGGALPGALSHVVRELRGRGLLCGHITAGPAYGGEEEAITTAGAVHYGLTQCGWDAVVCGPGPGILGSGSQLGHGGMVALDSAHAVLALGCEAVVVARMSSGEERPRHRGLSHHTRTVLELLLAPVSVGVDGAIATEQVREWQQIGCGHTWRRFPVQLNKYQNSGLPSTTMGRTLTEDSLFFKSAIAGGYCLAQTARYAKGEQQKSRV